ncbi:hypothetical protein [Streptomyces sp. NPDC056154]|uniref:hypothetical protein n=1 Tax=unclassified Streptomyces TaxID=2593676 RepID=UPI0035DCC992
MKRSVWQPTGARLLAGIGALVAAACSDLVVDLHVRRGQQGVQAVRRSWTPCLRSRMWSAPASQLEALSPKASDLQ